MANFIGIEAVQEIAKKYEPQLVLGAAYYNPSEMERLHIKTVSGVQFKLVKNLFVRKGGTTRRKTVTDMESRTAMHSKIGFIRERTLTAKLTMNMFWDNEDRYIETPVQIEGSSNFHYPYSEEAFLACTATYGEDLYANLWSGDIENGAAGYDLYDGYLTYIKQDQDNGFISTSKGNVKKCAAFTLPTDNDDIQAWNAWDNFRLSLDARLRQKQLLCVYLAPTTLQKIMSANINKNRGNSGIKMLDNGNVKFVEQPKYEFIPVEEWTGTGIIVTTPGNFIYAVDTADGDTSVSVRQGSDMDHKDISYQIQSVQGAMLFNPLASEFAMSDGTFTTQTFQGDYTDTTVVTATNDSSYGTVAITGKTKNSDGTYTIAEGSTFEVKATAADGKTFSKWADGNTDATRTATATGDVMVFTAIFA